MLLIRHLDSPPPPRLPPKTRRSHTGELRFIDSSRDISSTKGVGMRVRSLLVTLSHPFQPPERAGGGGGGKEWKAAGDLLLLVSSS